MYLYKSFRHLKTTHSYHLVDPSPWPIVAAFAAFMLTTGGVLYLQRFIGGWSLFFTGFIGLLYVMYTWWRDVVREATFEDTHTVAVQKGLRLGMILFIVSEVMWCLATESDNHHKHELQSPGLTTQFLQEQSDTLFWR
eukprot:scaffold43698_cov2413-Amphora_coffeaeformis.AAC.4